MQTQCVGRYGLRHFLVLAALLLLSRNGAAQIAEPSPSPTATPPAFSGFIDLAASQKPEYYIEPGRSIDVGARLSYGIQPGVRLGLIQGVSFNDQITAPAKSHAQLGDTLLRLAFPNFASTMSDQLKMTGLVQGLILTNSPTAEYVTLTNTLGARIITEFSVDAVSFNNFLDVTQNFHRLTFAPNGQSNAARSATIAVGLGYALTQQLSADASYHYITQSRYNGHKNYLFKFLSGLNYQITPRYKASIGLETSDAYLKEFGGVEADYIYQEDLSQISIGLECKL
jgi:opacity protein-like surface antigen